MAEKNGIRLLADLGTTNTKYGFYHGGKLSSNYLSTNDIIKDISVIKRLGEELYEQKFHSLPVIEQIILSISGVPGDDHRSILNSRLLRNYEGMDMQDLFGIPTLVVNDSLPNGVGAVSHHLHELVSPVLSINIGTYACFAVIEFNSQTKKFTRISGHEDWQGIDFPEAMGGKNNENTDDTVYTEKFNKSIKEVLQKYAESNEPEPMSIIVSGGASHKLIDNQIGRSVNAGRPLILTQLNSTELPLVGCSIIGSINNFKDIVEYHN